MALINWRRADLFFQPEAYFSFAIEFVKSSTNITTGYEIYMKPGDPHNFYPPYMFGAAFASIAAAIIADSYVRKFYSIVFGVVFLFLSCAFHLLGFVITQFSFYFYNTSVICLLMYVATSVGRNVFLIEQIDDYTHLRIVIFVLIYIRLIWRGITSLHLIFPEMYFYTKWAIVIAALIVIAYFVLLIWKGSKIDTEREHFNIVCKSFRCLFNAIRKKKKLEFLKQQEREAESVAKSLRHQSQDLGAASTDQPNRRRSRRWSKKQSQAYEETIYFVKVLPWLVLGLLVSNLTYFILTVTAAQREFSHVGGEIGFNFVKLYTLLFELLLLPFVEFVFLRYTKVFVHKNLALTMLGYLLLIFSSLILLGICITDVRRKPIEPSLQDELPEEVLNGSAKLIIVNLSKSPVRVYSYWSRDIFIKGNEGMIQRGKEVMHEGVYRMKWVLNETRKIVSSADNYKTNVTSIITLFQGKVVTYFTHDDGLCPVFPDGPNKTASPNPSGKRRPVVIKKINCLVDWNRCNYSGWFTFEVRPDNLRVESGEYYGECTAGKKEIYTFEADHEFKRMTYTFKEHTYFMVTTVLHLRISHRDVNFSVYDLGFNRFNVSNETVIEFPPIESTDIQSGSRNILIIQIFIASLGYCFSTVSYYAFLFYESPPKMRTTTLSIILMFHFITAGAYGYAKANLIFVSVHVVSHVVFFAALCYPVWKESRVEPTLGE